MSETPVGGTIGMTVPDGWFTVGQAAAQCGRSTDTLKRWARSGRFRPSGVMRAGELDVSLYSERDIELLREVAANTHAGRPTKNKTPQEV